MLDEPLLPLLPFHIVLFLHAFPSLYLIMIPNTFQLFLPLCPYYFAPPCTYAYPSIQPPLTSHHLLWISLSSSFHSLNIEYHGNLKPQPGY